MIAAYISLHESDVSLIQNHKADVF